MRTEFGDLIDEVQEVDESSRVPLGTAQWMGLREAAEKLTFISDKPSDQIWLGEAFAEDAFPLGALCA
jgi:hypothetical protein